MRKYVDEEIEPFAFEWEETGRVPDEVGSYKFFECKEDNRRVILSTLVKL